MGLFRAYDRYMHDTPPTHLQRRIHSRTKRNRPGLQSSLAKRKNSHSQAPRGGPCVFIPASSALRSTVNNMGSRLRGLLSSLPHHTRR
jgi:hypothetical protein